MSSSFQVPVLHTDSTIAILIGWFLDFLSFRPCPSERITFQFLSDQLEPFIDALLLCVPLNVWSEFQRVVTEIGSELWFDTCLQRPHINRSYPLMVAVRKWRAYRDKPAENESPDADRKQALDLLYVDIDVEIHKLRNQPIYPFADITALMT